MRFSRVVGVVAERWSSAARVANALEGRALFPDDLEGQGQGQSGGGGGHAGAGAARREIQRQVSGDVLYLLLATGCGHAEAPYSSSSSSGGPGVAGGSDAKTGGRASRRRVKGGSGGGGGGGRAGRGRDGGGGARGDVSAAVSKQAAAAAASVGGTPLAEQQRLATDTLRRLTLLCLCSHTVLWVCEPGGCGGASLRAMRSLTALTAARQRVVSAMSAGTGRASGSSSAHSSGGGSSSSAGGGGGLVKKGWPGRCQPWLVLVFLDESEERLPALQESVTVLMAACGLDLSSAAKNSALRAKARCCSYVSASFENDDGRDDDNADSSGGLAHLRSTMKELDPPPQQQTRFAIADWMDAAGKLVDALKMPDDASGLMAAVRQQQQSGDGAAPEDKAPSGSKKGGGGGKASSSGGSSTNGSNNSSAKVTAALEKCGAFVDGYFHMEDKLQQALCERALPAALEAYAHGLPKRYNKAVHDTQWGSALREFRSTTGHKGALGRRYERRLADVCRRVWRGTATAADLATAGAAAGDSGGRALGARRDRERDRDRDRDRAGDRDVSTALGAGSAIAALGPMVDRRLCDAVSLAGHPCTELMRACLTDNALDLRKCRSGVTQRLACACGRSIIERADPFTAAAADDCFSGVCCVQAKSEVVPSTPVSGEQGSLSSSPSPLPALPWALTVLDAGLVSRAAGNTIDLPHLVSGFNRLELAEGIGGQVLVGLEFECVAGGVRQILGASQLRGFAHGDNDFSNQGAGAGAGSAATAAAQWPAWEVEVFMLLDPSVAHVTHANVLQLQRIYVFNGGDTPVRLTPAVGFLDGAGVAAAEFSVPAGALVALALPHVWSQHMQLPLVRKRSAAWLRPGLVRSSAPL